MTRENVPGVAAVGRRYQVNAADSFRLGEPVQLVAYPGDHTEFEAPPLADGRRIPGPGDIEVGQGMADALGLNVGSVFAAQLPGRRGGPLPRERHRPRARRTTGGSRGWSPTGS